MNTKEMTKKENIIVAIAALVTQFNSLGKKVKPNFYVMHPSTKVDAKAKEFQTDGIIVEWPNGMIDKTAYEHFDVEDLKNILEFLLSI